MKVLHVNSVDLQGRRFNGYDLLDDLPARGITARQAVLTKQSDDPRVFALLSRPEDQSLHDAVSLVEQRRSMNGLLFPWGRVLSETDEFRSADVVHYHLLQNQVASLLDLPSLFSLKPSVWTFHDPWPMTGHCIHPLECRGWLDDCSPCPYLDRRYAMKEDRAGQMWKVKQRVYTELDVDIVVASEFMLDMVRRSPLTVGLERVHLIPFGVKSGSFLADSKRVASRSSLGIPEDDLVLLFRSAPGEIKGLDYIVDALRMAPPSRPTTLVTLDRKGLVEELRGHYNIVELGWVEDSDLYARVFSACDVFLMPSAAEAFGLMALEAMAAGRPVVCFQQTAVESVIRPPQCGIAVPPRDFEALRAAIDMIASDPQGVQQRGQLARSIAKTVFAHDRYVNALAGLYSEVSERFKAGANQPSTA